MEATGAAWRNDSGKPSLGTGPLHRSAAGRRRGGGGRRALGCVHGLLGRRHHPGGQRALGDPRHPAGHLDRPGDAADVLHRRLLEPSLPRPPRRVDPGVPRQPDGSPPPAHRRVHRRLAGARSGPGGRRSSRPRPPAPGGGRGGPPVLVPGHLPGRGGPGSRHAAAPRAVSMVGAGSPGLRGFGRGRRVAGPRPRRHRRRQLPVRLAAGPPGRVLLRRRHPPRRRPPGRARCWRPAGSRVWWP